MIELFPGPFVFHTQVDNHKDLKEKFLPIINRVVEDKRELLKNHWRCDCKTSLGKEERLDNFLSDFDLVKSIVWDPLNQMISEFKTKDGGLSSQGLNYEPSESSLQTIWFNQYDRGQYQEAHDHLGGTYQNNNSTFSGIYLLELTEPNGTTFIDKVGVPHDNFNFYTDHIHEGSVLIFPSSLFHYVSPVKNRKTSISFNVFCT
jgi:hypothetical protein